MSIFSCFEHLTYLKDNYPQKQAFFTEIENQVSAIEQADKPLQLSLAITALKERFPNITRLALWSPRLWLPLPQYDFTQRVKALTDELSACAQKARTIKADPIAYFQVPSIKQPMFCNKSFAKKYRQLQSDLQQLAHTSTAENIYQYWRNFEAETAALKYQLSHKKNAISHRFQAQQYIERRQAIQNQLALAYFHHKNKKVEINIEQDWRTGNDQHTGHGFIMALANPSFNPDNNSKYQLDPTIAEIEAARYDKHKDQHLIKHNRLQATRISTTQDRANTLLALMKQHPNKHLSIKLMSRGFKERYTYLQYQQSEQDSKLLFCDPTYGLYQFENDAEFLFFYQMLYAKEETQQHICWNRFQVSQMSFAPHKKPQFSWPGKIQSLLYGLKYNRAPLDIIKNIFLFNLIIFSSLVVLYSCANILAIFSQPAAMGLINLLAHSGFSVLVGSATLFGSAGLFALPDFAYAIYLSGLDNISTLLGGKTHGQQILHADFSLEDISSQNYQSHRHLLNQLPQAEQAQITPASSLQQTPSPTELKIDSTVEQPAQPLTL